MGQISDAELQAALRRLCEEAIRLYTKGSGSPTPERVIQVYSALELIKLGLVVAVETTGKQSQHWFNLPERAVRGDLVICDPSGDGNPDKARPRALVEFKMNPWNLDVDIERLARMVKETGCSFGYCLGCLCDSRPTSPQLAIGHVAKHHPNAASQAFSVPIGNGEQLHAAVIGVPVAASDCKESVAPEGEPSGHYADMPARRVAP
jgi:hypothetical protein